MKIQNILPAFEWARNYQKKDLRGDISAGLTVGVMLVPQGMAYSMLAGLPPIYGLYSAIIPILFYALLGTSRQLAVGPVAMASLLVASGVGAIAQEGTAVYLELAILLSLMVGIFRLLLGLMRLGFLVNFLSNPVISGYTSAAALIIGISQLKHLLGIPLANSSYIHEVLWSAVEKIGSINYYAFAIGTLGIVLLQLSKKIKQRYKIDIPGPLVVVIFGSLTVLGFGLEQSVAIVGEVPSGIPLPSMPSMNLEHLQALIPSAITIGLIGFLESIAVAKAIQAKHKNYQIDSNQELIALGAANIGGAFFQAFPVNGGFSRSAVNDQAGAKTQLASLISALLILLTLLFLTPLFYYLPQAVLASVVMVAVYGLIDFKEVKNLWKTDRRDLAMLIITFLATLGLGIEQGIFLGVILSLLLLIYQSTKPHIAILGRVPGSNHYRNLKRFEELEMRNDLLILRFDAQIYFANTAFLKENLENYMAAKGPTLKAVIFDAQSITGLDSSAVHCLEDISNDLAKRKIAWYWCDVKGPVRDVLERSGLTKSIGQSNFFIAVQDAVDYFDTQQPPPHQNYVLQTNL